MAFAYQTADQRLAAECSASISTDLLTGEMTLRRQYSSSAVIEPDFETYGANSGDVAAAENIFELANDSVMTRTMEGIINFWNHSAEELYGWRKEEAIGKFSHDLLQTQFPKPLEEIESELVRNGRWEGKLVHTTRDGGRVVVESRWCLDPEGTVWERSLRLIRALLTPRRAQAPMPWKLENRNDCRQVNR